VLIAASGTGDKWSSTRRQLILSLILPSKGTGDC
jgi:hypothetical protein